MTSKRIKKKKKTSKFVALLLLFKNREKELYPKTNDIQNTRRVLLRGWPTKKERERETKRGDDSCHFTSLSRAKKKFRFHMTWRENTTNNKRKRKRKKTTKQQQTTDFFFSRRKHFTPILEDSFIRKKSEYSCSLLLRSRRDQRCFFQEEILETINNKHRGSWALSCRVWLEH